MARNDGSTDHPDLDRREMANLGYRRVIETSHAAAVPEAVGSPRRRAGLRLALGGFMAIVHATSLGRSLKPSPAVRPFVPAQDNSGNIQGAVEQLNNVDLPESAADAWHQNSKDNFVVRRPAVVDDIRATPNRPTAGWVLATGSATLAFDGNESRSNTGATGCLRLSGLSALVSIRKDFGNRGIVPRDGVLVIPVKISEIPLTDADALPVVARPIAIIIELCSDENFSATTSARLAKSFIMTGFQFLRSGWNDLQLSSADDGTLNTTGTPGWTYSGNAPGNARTEYRHMRIHFQGLQATATQTPVVKLGGVYQNGACSANVLMCCDDGHQDSADIVRIFNAFNIPVSLSVITGIVGRDVQMTAAQLRAASRAGNDCTSHSATHPSGQGLQGLQGVTDAQLDDEVSESIAWLQANGLSRTANVFVYPENSFGQREIAAVEAAGYAVARGSRPGWIVTVFGIDSPFALGSRDVGGRTLAQVKKYLDSAQAYGCTQEICSHRIATIPITSMTVSANIGTIVHPAQSAPIPAGSAVCLRGFVRAACNADSIVRSGSTNTSFTVRLQGVADGVAAMTENSPWFFSPTYPAAGGPPPSNTLHWYASDFIALARELDRRRSSGTLTPIGYTTLLERCTLD